MNSAALPDDWLHHRAALEAARRHLHLVIDRDGRSYLTQILQPGMVKMACSDKQFAKAA